MTLFGCLSWSTTTLAKSINEHSKINQITYLSYAIAFRLNNMRLVVWNYFFSLLAIRWREFFCNKQRQSNISSILFNVWRKTLMTAGAFSVIRWTKILPRVQSFLIAFEVFEKTNWMKKIDFPPQKNEWMTCYIDTSKDHNYVIRHARKDTWKILQRSCEGGCE